MACAELVLEQLSGQELIVGYEDELGGQLADRVAESGRGRVLILRRSDDGPCCTARSVACARERHPE